MIRHYIDELDLRGEVLEIGGHRLDKCAVGEFPSPRFAYHDLNIEASDIPDTIIADITDCRSVIPDESFDIVFSSDVFEHLDRPWLAAPEIARILKPGGIAITYTLFSWRNHPCPIDYWRYSAECLEFLFSDLELLEKGYDLLARRQDQPGFWADGLDSVPVDQLGGWREHWAVYHVGRKGTGPAVSPFKYSEHPLAHYLRMDTQGVVTSPKLLGEEAPTIALQAQTQLSASAKRVEAAQADLATAQAGLATAQEGLAAGQTELAATLAGLHGQVVELSARLDEVSDTLAHPPPTDLQRISRSLRRRVRKLRRALG